MPDWFAPLISGISIGISFAVLILGNRDKK
jgi:hypothetical protein